MKIQIHIKCKYELRKRPLIWKVGKNLEKYSLKNSLFSKVASSRYSRLENLALLKILFLILKVVEIYAGPILERKGMGAVFQRKGKKGKIFENLGKNARNLKIFWKRAAPFVRLSHVWSNQNMPCYDKLEKNLFIFPLSKFLNVVHIFFFKKVTGW